MTIPIIILILLAILVYAWVAYPLLLLAMASLKKPVGMTQRIASSGTRRVAVVLAAHNEEKVILKRLENLMLFRPTSIHVGLDACTDQTAEMACGFAKDHPSVHVHDFKDRRGKAAVLRRIVGSGKEDVDCGLWTVDCGREDVGCGKEDVGSGMSSDDILVFTDANTVFDAHAMEKLVTHFNNPDVGGVCGRLVFVECVKSVDCGTLNVECGEAADVNTKGREKGEEGVYWEWETRLKTAESRVDSCLGANGAIYAIRASLFPVDLPDNTVVDDFVIGMKVRERGFRMVYEPAAVAYEDAAPGVRDEWKRRVRIGSGDFQSLMLCCRCLLPWYGKFAWMFWSHKVLRWFTPHLSLIVFVLAVAGAVNTQGRGIGGGIAVGVLGAGLLFLVFAAIGRVMRGWRVPLTGFFRLCDYFLTMQAALFAGFLRFCMGGLRGSWTRTSRG